jgi:thymidylate kinase/CYTH domain-containing protein
MAAAGGASGGGGGGGGGGEGKQQRPRFSDESDRARWLAVQRSGANPCFKIVLTGGPCGGKSTAATAISGRLQDLGWRVFRVPEAATLYFGGGISFPRLTPEQQYLCNLHILKIMLRLEDCFHEMAKATGERCVVLCDRGAMDVKAYMDEAVWQAMVDEQGLNTVSLRDSRYDCVVHLVTAADGAERFYTTQNNATRTESPEHARVLDARIKENWIGHSRFHVIDNSSDFQTKMDRAVTAICEFVGEKTPGDLKKRKFLVVECPVKIPVEAQEFSVEHDYLAASSPNVQMRLRRRGQFGTFTYTLTTRFSQEDGRKPLELRKLLSGREYVNLKRQKDPEHHTVVKTRWSFLYKDRYFALDLFHGPKNGLMMLEAYLSSNDNTLPDFLRVEREVTRDPEFSMYSISRISNDKPFPVAKRVA